MGSVSVEVEVDNSRYNYSWESMYSRGSAYAFQAKEALNKLDEAYARIKAAINANMPSENKVTDDRPVIEKRVDSGPVTIQPVKRC